MASRDINPTTRKRLRSQTKEDPSSTASKKRRLKSSDSSPVAVARSKPESQTTNGILARGRRKTAVSTAEDSRAVSETPKSEDEHDRKKAEKSQISAIRQTASVYDVPDSDEDELATPAVAPRPGRQRPGIATSTELKTSGVNGVNNVNGVNGVNGDETGRKKRGRPGKQYRQAVARDSLQTEGEEAKDAAAPTGLSRPQARRPRGIPNGRLEEDAQVPQGIMTPRKGGDAPGRQRKRVAFDRKLDGELQDGSATATPSNSAKKRKGAASLLVEDEVEEDASSGEEDDEVCAICSKPDSDPGNEIVFCDKCDVAVHQECYGLPEIPEGDWICRDCLQDSASSAGFTGANGVKPSVAGKEDQKPDIPNFEEHLRSMQRVLLDRCAGRRRIKLRGQDGAYEKAYQLVEQTIVAGEGNSMLVIGARGCGKTTVRYSVTC